MTKSHKQRLCSAAALLCCYYSAAAFPLLASGAWHRYRLLRLLLLLLLLLLLRGRSEELARRHPAYTLAKVSVVCLFGFCVLNGFVLDKVNSLVSLICYATLTKKTLFIGSTNLYNVVW